VTVKVELVITNGDPAQFAAQVNTFIAGFANASGINASLVIVHILSFTSFSLFFFFSSSFPCCFIYCLFF
jgi:hypothetical protein